MVLKEWFSEVIKDWLSVVLKDWFSEVIKEWFSVVIKEWFSVVIKEWFSVVLKDWFSVVLKDWFSVVLKDWFSEVLKDCCHCSWSCPLPSPPHLAPLMSQQALSAWCGSRDSSYLSNFFLLLKALIIVFSVINYLYIFQKVRCVIVAITCAELIVQNCIVFTANHFLIVQNCIVFTTNHFLLFASCQNSITSAI